MPFACFLEYLLLSLDVKVDEESTSFSNSKSNTEKYQLVILFGGTKHLKLSVFFLRGSEHFLPKSSLRSYFSQEWKKMVIFYYKSFPYTTFKTNAKSFQNTTLGFCFLVDFSEILKIISKCIFFFWIAVISNQFQPVKLLCG